MEGWTKISSFDSDYQAELQQALLAQNDIKAVILNEKDSAFLLGEVELYVEEEFAEKALQIIENSDFLKAENEDELDKEEEETEGQEVES